MAKEIRPVDKSYISESEKMSDFYMLLTDGIDDNGKYKVNLTEPLVFIDRVWEVALVDYEGPTYSETIFVVANFVRDNVKWPEHGVMLPLLKMIKQSQVDLDGELIKTNGHLNKIITINGSIGSDAEGTGYKVVKNGIFSSIELTRLNRYMTPLGVYANDTIFLIHFRPRTGVIMS